MEGPPVCVSVCCAVRERKTDGLARDVYTRREEMMRKFYFLFAPEVVMHHGEPLLMHLSIQRGEQGRPRAAKDKHGTTTKGGAAQQLFVAQSDQLITHRKQQGQRDA